MPTDFEQSTGLERLELIGKMQGYDIFDLKPLDASRKGMLAIVVYPIDDSMFKWRGPCSKCRVSMCTNFFFFFFNKGTLEDPIIVHSVGDEQYAGCTGYPADSHITNWLTVS